MAWPTGMPLVTITQDVHKLPDGSLPSSYAVHLQLSVPASRSSRSCRAGGNVVSPSHVNDIG